MRMRFVLWNMALWVVKCDSHNNGNIVLGHINFSYESKDNRCWSVSFFNWFSEATIIVSLKNPILTHCSSQIKNSHTFSSNSNFVLFCEIEMIMFMNCIRNKIKIATCLSSVIALLKQKTPSFYSSLYYLFNTCNFALNGNWWILQFLFVDLTIGLWTWLCALMHEVKVSILYLSERWTNKL